MSRYLKKEKNEMTKPHEVFFGSPETKDVTKQKKTTTKNYDQLLAIQEFNIEQGMSKISDPYAKSYIVYRAVRSIAENIPQAKYRVYFSNNDKPVPVTHPMNRLFNRPNPFMSRFEFWEAISTHLNLSGEVGIYVNESRGGAAGLGTPPAELYVLNPKLLRHSINDGEITGWVYNNTMPIETKNLIHFKLFNPSNFSIRGLSPLDPARNEMDADFSASKFNKNFFENDATPNGIIEISEDNTITDVELRALKKSWYQKYGGVENAHRTVFLKGGMTYKSMGISQREMDFLEGRQFSRDSILSVFGVHPFVAGFYDSGTVTRATAKEAKALFWRGTLKPQLIRIEEKMNVDFFGIHAPQFYGKFDYSEVEELQEDYDAAVITAKGLFDLGYDLNEVNERMNLDMPEKDFAGYRPFNIQRYELDGKIEEPVEDDSEPQKMLKEAKKIENKEIKKQFTRNFNKIQSQMERILQSKLKRYLYNQRSEILTLLNSEKDFDPELANTIAQINTIFENNKDEIVKLVEPVYRETSTATGEMVYDYLSLDKEFIVNETILNNRLNLVKGINDTLYGRLKESINEGIQSGETINDISNRVRDIYTSTSSKSKVIARTETASLMNGTSVEIYKEEGIGQLEWISEGDARESHQINGETTTIGQPFSNGLLYPGDPSAPPEEVVNCRCSTAPVIRV
jgi:HK97 family phage portal protein